MRRISSCCFALAALSCAHAARIDITGPSGSGQFGAAVFVLLNGNVVATDPDFSLPGVANVGAVYLYTAGGTLISTFTGSAANDHVGNGGVTLLANGNFVVASTNWNNAAVAGAGAATWVSGNTGLSGVVTAVNSLVGSGTNDHVGSSGIYGLTNGNYVVESPQWQAGFGAATWGNGASGISGTISSGNSLVGAAAGDAIGNHAPIVLNNGNYVVLSQNWNNASGAATWGNGMTGVTGTPSITNSLIGSTPGDNVGYDGGSMTGNSNYIVVSPSWNGNRGASTWGNGASGTTGQVSSSNSMVGTTPGDLVGALARTLNGNYLIGSPYWGGMIGAATWGNGSTGSNGFVSASNSIIGSASGDHVGQHFGHMTNGNYLVRSAAWNGGRGAVTWASGTGTTSLVVSAANSLVGSTPGDHVGTFELGMPILSNGNFVVKSPDWNGGTGAATWGNGSTGVTGAVSSGNSLVGAVAGDRVGSIVSPLLDGNYAVGSPAWSGKGAATWGNGSTGITGSISSANSLVGATPNDQIGAQVTALFNGNYVVMSPGWSNATSTVGAITWARAGGGTVGTIDKASLAGTSANDAVGSDGAELEDDGNYLVVSSQWSGGAGAITLASSLFRTKGTIQTWNSVLGTAATGGASMTYAYDPVHHQLVAGRPADNIVSLFTMDQIFADDFDP